MFFFYSMARYLILAAVLIANALADDGYAAPSSQGYAAPSSQGYAAPSDGYGAPNDGYGAPTAPADGYGAPSDGYGAASYNEPTGYASGSAVAAPANDFLSIEKWVYLVPFFLAVLAAIIIAQIITPAIAALIGAKIDLANQAVGAIGGAVGGAAAGVGGAGALPNLGLVPLDLLNAVLTPFNLAICTTNPLALAGTPATGRGFNLDPESVKFAASMLYNAYESKY